MEPTMENTPYIIGSTTKEPTKRERRTSYFLGTVIAEFKSRIELEQYLNANGGSPSGLELIKGSRVVASATKTFKINC